MKILVISIFLFISLTAIAGISEIRCTNEKSFLRILISEIENQKIAKWELESLDEVALLSGQGQWTKEKESEDAFSAFDDSSAISFKNSRAVIILEDDFVLVFNSCTSQ